MSILNGEKSTRNAIGSIILFEYRTSTEIGIFTVQNRTSKYRVHISRIQVEINKNITISNKKNQIWYVEPDSGRQIFSLLSFGVDVVIVQNATQTNNRLELIWSRKSAHQMEKVPELNE